MKIDPFEDHPEQKKSKKQKYLLTKENLFAMINLTIQEIENSETPIWGYTQLDLLSVLDNLINKIEEGFENVIGK